MSVLVLIFICSLGGSLICMGSCMTIFNKTIGIISLVIGLIMLVVVLTVYFVLRNKKEKEAAERKKERELRLEQERTSFNEWLEQTGFEKTNEIGDFWIDATNKKWCKYLNSRVYGFSDIVNAKVQKHSSRTTTNSSTRTRNSKSSGNSSGHSGLFFNNSHKGSRSGSTSTTSSNKSRGTSIDTSTYDVHITTKILDEPLVVISCGMSPALADKICSAIDIMLEKKKTKREKEHKNDE